MSMKYQNPQNLDQAYVNEYMEYYDTLDEAGHTAWAQEFVSWEQDTQHVVNNVPVTYKGHSQNNMAILEVVRQ